MPTKRWLYLAVCLATILSLLSACTAVTPSASPGAAGGGSTASAEVPTLDYYYVAFAAKPEDLQEVEDAANAILVDKIGGQGQTPSLDLCRRYHQGAAHPAER